MANTTLTNAREAKQDEFYTQYYDIEREVEAYLDYNPDVFRGKTVLLPCDDPCVKNRKGCLNTCWVANKTRGCWMCAYLTRQLNGACTNVRPKRPAAVE